MHKDDGGWKTWSDESGKEFDVLRVTRGGEAAKAELGRSGLLDENRSARNFECKNSNRREHGAPGTLVAQREGRAAPRHAASARPAHVQRVVRMRQIRCFGKLRLRLAWGLYDPRPSHYCDPTSSPSAHTAVHFRTRPAAATSLARPDRARRDDVFAAICLSRVGLCNRLPC